MRKTSLILAGLILVGALTCAGLRSQEKSKDSQEPAKKEQAPAEESKIPAEEAKRTNPVKPTPESLAESRRLYGYDCAMCHGKTGDGKGDLAADMKLTLRDWRDPATLAGMADGEIFYVIRKGKGKMTGEEDRLKNNQIWGLVNVVRSFVKTEPSEKAKPDPAKQ